MHKPKKMTEPLYNDGQLRQLRDAIEISLGREMRTPRDFDFLRQCIFARTRNMISASTLKRLWNYMPQGKVRETTLSLLAQFLGYKSWDAFLRGDRTEGASDFILSRHLWTDDIEPETHINLTWHPGRRCLIRYIGNGSFEVVESENTRLKPQMTFRCGKFIEGEPLFIDRLTIDGVRSVSYVCGKISGIHFELE